MGAAWAATPKAETPTTIANSFFAQAKDEPAEDLFLIIGFDF